MQNLILIALVGLIAQLVDGSLGMAYGVTSTTLLLLAGISPSIASASVHLSEVGTTLVSGLAHWRFGNVDWGKILWLGIPGGIAAFIGAVLLSSISAEFAEPIVAVILFGLGIYILFRFLFSRTEKLIVNRSIPKFLLVPLGLVAGLVDALGGGGWGPIATTSLLSSQRLEPRKVVGTVDTSEFIVSVAASVGFLISLNFADIPLPIVGVLLLGGVAAAPLAAWLVRHLNARILGTAVGGFILLTNARTFMNTFNLADALTIPIYALILVVWISALSYAIYVTTRDRKLVTTPAETEATPQEA